MDQSVFNMTVITVPVALGLIAWKPPKGADLGVAIRVLAYSLLLISLASLIVGGLGWMPNGFRAEDVGGGRFLVLEQFGVPGRWSGPYGNANYASPIGDLLVVIGLSQRHSHKWLISVGGMVIIVLGQGRTAIFATVAAVLVVLL